MVSGEGNLHPRRPLASTLANTPAEGNQRFHLRTESLWIPVTKPGRTHTRRRRRLTINIVVRISISLAILSEYFVQISYRYFF